MTDKTPADIAPKDITVAALTGQKIDHLLQELATLATAFDTTMTIPQVLSGILAATWDTNAPLTRDEWIAVYDYVAKVQSTLSAFFGSGPEATADVESKEGAALLAEYWGDKIADAAFSVPDFAPNSLDEFPPQQDA